MTLLPITLSGLTKVQTEPTHILPTRTQTTCIECACGVCDVHGGVCVCVCVGVYVCVWGGCVRACVRAKTYIEY